MFLQFFSSILTCLIFIIFLPYYTVYTQACTNIMLNAEKERQWPLLMTDSFTHLHFSFLFSYKYGQTEVKPIDFKRCLLTTTSCNMPKTNLCRRKRPMLS